MPEWLHVGEKGYRQAWETLFCSTPVDWRYGLGWQHYIRAYSGSRLANDFSFVLKHKGEPVAICPLLLEDIDGVRQFSSGGWYQMAPFANPALPTKSIRKFESLCFEHIADLAHEHRVAIAMTMLSPLSSAHRHNMLVEHGFLDASTQSAAIILSEQENKLWLNIRKSYRPLINKGISNYSILIFDHTNPQRDAHEEYRRLHYLAAGRATRTQETFDIMFDELCQDRALLIGTKANDRFVAFSYYLHDSRSAYYGSSCDDPDFTGPAPLEHLITWSAIQYYKQRGFHALEFGPQQFGPQLFDIPSPKELSICFFKRGFGPQQIPFFRGVRYFDKAFMKRDLAQKLDALLTTYEPV